MTGADWRAMLPRDPLPRLLASSEPSARWVALVELLDRRPGDPEVRAAHEAVLADEGTRELLDRLPDWERPQQIDVAPLARSRGGTGTARPPRQGGARG